ncbi:hypothetical protein FJT64_002118 [Amphibalanus amphitrite]|uniref:FAR1 domain-containing protein n=1 Tax=Amphibalanus amphitrite TaxID=1232801 RepID=A0A6A4WS16_AMPAM|nr:hypothetical protein FJT64_002118 [Amphibalanus amphitrite]
MYAASCSMLMDYQLIVLSHGAVMAGMVLHEEARGGACSGSTSQAPTPSPCAFKRTVCTWCGEQELLNGTTLAYRCQEEETSAQKWLKLFEATTKTSFSVFSVCGRNGIIYQARLRCHRQPPGRVSRPRKKQPAKDTGCGMKVTALMTRIPNRNRSKHPCAGYALRITSNGEPHNHAVETAAALRYRKVPETTDARLLELSSHHHFTSLATGSVAGVPPGGSHLILELVTVVVAIYV